MMEDYKKLVEEFIMVIMEFMMIQQMFQAQLPVRMPI